MKIVHPLCLKKFVMPLKQKHDPKFSNTYRDTVQTTSYAIHNRRLSSNTSLAPGLCKSLYKLPLKFKAVTGNNQKIQF